MTEVTHPNLPGVTKTVEDSAVPRWAAAGWLVPETADPTRSADDDGEHDTPEETE